MCKIRELKGQNGKVILHETYLEMSRDTLGGRMSQGGASGSRRFLLRDIAGIEYKRPTFWSNGYIKVLVSGTDDVNAKVGLLGSSTQSMQDQNTLVLRAFKKAKTREADEMYDLIMEYYEKAKQSLEGPSKSSKMDELAKMAALRESGVLSDDEFQRGKAKLLAG